jgi:O-antigen/teichoic acid export membrane protein
LQPVLSDYQDDVSKIREIYYKIVHILALIGIPLSVFLSLASQQIIFFLYGPQWGDAVEPFTILALTVWVQMTLSSTGGIYQARNQTNLLLINGIVSATIIVASIIVGVFLGTINFVAITLSVGFVINFFVSFTILTKLTLKSNLFIFMKEFINPFILGMLVFVTQKLVGIIHIDILFLELLIRGSVFAIALISFIMLTKEKELLKMVIGKKR